MKYLMFACFAGAILLPGSWFSPSHSQNVAIVPAGAKQDLLKAAKAHNVKIKADKISYFTNPKLTIVRAPIEGIEKYGEADFDKGAAVVLVIIKSTTKLAIPDGSYVVKIQYQRNAKSGKVIFTNPAGGVVVERDRDLPILALPGPDLPDPSDLGERLELDNCAIYRDMFPQLCAICACNYYRRGLSNDTVGPDPREVLAFFAGLHEGQACARSTPLRCR